MSTQPGTGHPERRKVPVGVAWDRCPEAAGMGDHGPLTSAGHCPWCGRKVAAPALRPRRFAVSNLTLAWRRFYDPDWGGGPEDSDPDWQD